MVRCFSSPVLLKESKSQQKTMKCVQDLKSTQNLSSLRCFVFVSLLQASAGLWPTGLCIRTVPPGGVYMDLHVPLCACGSLHPVPAVGTESGVFQKPQALVRTVGLTVLRVPRCRPGFPAYLRGGQPCLATCILLCHYTGAGKQMNPVSLLPHIVIIICQLSKLENCHNPDGLVFMIFYYCLLYSWHSK